MVRMSFLNHLEELRTRIIQALIGLGIAYAFCLLFATYLVGWMIQPVKRAFEMLEGVCQFDAPLKLVAITPSCERACPRPHGFRCPAALRLRLLR